MAAQFADDSALSDDDARQRWQQLRAVFDMAADAALEDRAGIITTASDGDAQLAARVLRLLSAATDGDDDINVRFALDGDDSSRIGGLVGNYRITRLIGCGGMGAVYEAVRADGVYTQRVAIKLVRVAAVAHDLGARFRRERQILASLQHSNVARLLDGGATPTGEPFLVMEFVEGAPVTAWSDQHRLRIRDRLQLFLQACDAVSHAHGRFVVHRDLKPANILVSADGAVKLLDFGVAKLLGSEEGDPEIGAVTAARPFTPEYASPEQLRDQPASAASDVYSLGVVLFELLSGSRPYSPTDRSADSTLYAIEHATAKPSAMITSIAATARRESDARRLQRTLRGELDNIVRRAMHPDAAMRYQSVEQLADDVRRYLSGMPVAAQPDSLRYRVRKFAGRHRGTGIAVTAIVLASLVVATLLTRSAVSARNEREWQLRVGTASTLDELSLVRIDDGHIAAADSLLHTAIALCNQRPAADELPFPCEHARFDMGIVALWRGDLDVAATMLRATYAAARAAGPAGAPWVGRASSALAQVRDMRGDFAGADSLFREASAAFESAGLGRSGDEVDLLGWRAIANEHVKRYDVADSLITRQRRLVGGVDAGVVELHHAWVRAQLGDVVGTRRYADSARIFGANTPLETSLLYPRISGAIGGIELALGDTAGGLDRLRKALQSAMLRYRADDPRVAELAMPLGVALAANGQRVEAEKLLHATADALTRDFGAANPRTVEARGLWEAFGRGK